MKPGMHSPPSSSGGVCHWRRWSNMPTPRKRSEKVEKMPNAMKLAVPALLVLSAISRRFVPSPAVLFAWACAGRQTRKEFCKKIAQLFLLAGVESRKHISFIFDVLSEEFINQGLAIRG